jgi:hypothetical protein
VLLRERARLAESNASLVSENVGLQMLLEDLTLLLSGQVRATQGDKYLLC